MAPFSSTLANGIINRGVHYGRGWTTSLAINETTTSTAMIRSRNIALVKFPGIFPVCERATRMVVTSTNVISSSISYGPPEWTMHLTTKFTVYNRSSVW